MPTIAEHLGVNPKSINFEDHPALPGFGALGYEVELENSEGGWPSVKGWVRKEDGSLRDGKEYIFDGPQSGPTALASLEAFHKAMAERVKPDPTFRCSTHVHLDIRDLDFTVYERVILAYIVYEDVMFDMVDRRRRDSNFCIPFYKNDWLSAAFGRRVLAATSDARKFQGCGNWPKYSALNLQVTASFGSIEFRGGHAMTDKRELLSLGQRMLHLKRVAVNSAAKTHYEFLTEIEAMGAHGVFIQGIPGDYVMDEGALEQGMATAMHALMQGEIHKLAPEEAGIFGQAPRQPRDPRRDTARTVMGHRARLNTGRLLALNVQPPQGPSMQNALHLLVALNKLNGVTVHLSHICDMNVFIGGGHRWLIDNVDYIREQYGIPVTREMLL